MSFPDLEYRTAPVRESDADLLLVALPPLEADASPDLSDWPGLRDALLGVGFTGAPGSWVRAYAPEVTALPLAVVGTGSDPDAAALRDAVGAAIRAEDGKIYTGANIENLSFPEGWCAETTAISHMVMAGQRKIMEVAVIAEKLALCPPCGGCRQRLAEFSGASTRIFLCDETGVKKTLALSDLLPHSFETEILG